MTALAKNGLSWLARGAICLIPAISYSHRDAYLAWPPLGSINAFAAGAGSLVVTLFAVLPSAYATKSNCKKWAATGSVVALITLAIYAFLLLSYVKQVPTPDGGTLYRSIGSQRSAEAMQDNYRDKSDVELLEIAGLDDAAIERMWTPSSVHRVRLGLFLVYVACLASINVVVGSTSKSPGEKLTHHSSDD